MSDTFIMFKLEQMKDYILISANIYACRKRIGSLITRTFRRTRWKLKIIVNKLLWLSIDSKVQTTHADQLGSTFSFHLSKFCHKLFPVPYTHL